jgi:superfamily II DNA or RNA helicase
MPRIFDNIALQLLPDLRLALQAAYRADFCVGYLNLRGWKALGDQVDAWPGGEGHCVRLLVGMQRLPQDELRTLYQFAKSDDLLDNQTMLRLKRRLAEEFREQLTIGAPTDEDERALRQLAAQLRARQVVVKLYLRHLLHAKLYLLHRQDPFNPIIGYVGSSNLTLAGLSHQGELNVDVPDGDACVKLASWFEDRWNDRGCVNISDELVKIIEESWAREEAIPPYHIYVKMAYHLSREARAGLSEFRIPRDFGNRLFEFQTAAVKIAAHHLNKRGGVLIGDVVGLGKTLMATAIARIFEDDQDLETLIICPKNLVKMWQGYRDQYRLRARVLSASRVLQKLPDMRRYRIVVIDESHNLRNREGKRYRAIQEYIQKNESRCILLSATPYNKSYLDLSNQLRLFVPEDLNLGIRPERLLRDVGETEFIRRHQSALHSLAAFEHSPYAEDWRELMRLYMVRRTRSFIMDNYAQADPTNGRKYLTFADGTHFYFPNRVPKRLSFAIRDDDPADQYARLYTPEVVETINSLKLPRYGLGNYVLEHVKTPKDEDRLIQDLSRAGRRLMGFCRTNLFKRLESSGQVFLESIERHILRNEIYLYAIDSGLHLPIGTQEAALLDTRLYDGDTDRADPMDDSSEGEDEPADEMLREGIDETGGGPQAAQDYAVRAAHIYQLYANSFRSRFKWLRADLFQSDLADDLRRDSKKLASLLERAGAWNPARDAKLQALRQLLCETHPYDKVIVFTQFADTVRYLERCLEQDGVERMAGVVGGASDPTAIAWRFSPVSNEVRGQIRPEDDLRVLISTDVLSEGQNVQDGYIVVNYDLPWAIVRLIQRAGRVDRIGQKAAAILCYSFLPADGVERILNLRARVRQRLQENAEVLGTDESFFEDDMPGEMLRDLYNEKAGLLDGEEDREVDLASYAYQIWRNAVALDPSLQRIIPELPPVVYSTKAHAASAQQPQGALVYVRTGEGNDSLAWVAREGRNVTQSQFDILRAAECAPNTPALSRPERHHALVQQGVAWIAEQERAVGGQLGRPSGARFRTYERLKSYADRNQGTLFVTEELRRAIDEIYRYPLRETARDTLNRQLRSGIEDQQLAELVVSLRAQDRLCVVEEEVEAQEPQIICSLGLASQ